MTRVENTSTWSHKIGSDKMKQVGKFKFVLLLDAMLGLLFLLSVHYTYTKFSGRLTWRLLESKQM